MVETLRNIFSFIGGIGLFIYGMHMMSQSMQRIAGAKFNNIVSILTKNKFMGVLVGALFTIVMNSSAATTIMVIGFVNAGIMTLNQTVGVIMGANIGTTVTSWIVSLAQFGDTFEIIQPSFFAPLIIGITSFIVILGKKEFVKTKAYIFLGFGLLFLGLSFMKNGVMPYSQSEIFSKAFVILGANPILGIIAGAIVTAMLQSSAASVSILQTLALNGAVNRGAAYYITMGQNIGTCITAIFSSAGGNKNGKRTALIHLLFNLFGAILFTIVLCFITPMFRSFMADKINSVDISIFHTGFNIINTLLLFPITDFIVSITKKIIPDNVSDISKLTLSEKTQSILDRRILEQPQAAINTTRHEIIYYTNYAKKNLIKALDVLLDNRTEEKLEEVLISEVEIDKTDRILTDYLVIINKLNITMRQHQIVEDMLSMCSDIERIGDHAEGIAKNAMSLIKADVDFSDMAKDELKEIGYVTLSSIDAAIKCIDEPNEENIQLVRKYEDEVDVLQKTYRTKHLKRLANGECNVVAGIVFLDTIGNLERISDHANNIADYVSNEIKDK